jgi:aspartate/methionine/tyrosine aminotransferase
MLDLTASNPTQCGFAYDPKLLVELSAVNAALYEPDPRGMLDARHAVCGYYADHDARVDPHQVVLTTSTSEGYSWLFRLLCDPGDEVLIAQPSYPLFDLLATIDDVKLTPYGLLYDPGGSHGWSLDLHALRARITPRTRAVVVVHPNNPTGHYTSRAEREALSELCRVHELALIVDEVFLDYPLGDDASAEPAHSFAQGEQKALTFVLSGLSKVAALPQMKASWIVCLGPEDAGKEAMRRLEIIADTFLSMNAPVQHALPCAVQPADARSCARAARQDRAAGLRGRLVRDAAHAALRNRRGAGGAVAGAVWGCGAPRKLLRLSRAEPISGEPVAAAGGLR